MHPPSAPARWSVCTCTFVQIGPPAGFPSSLLCPAQILPPYLPDADECSPPSDYSVFCLVSWILMSLPCVPWPCQPCVGWFPSGSSSDPPGAQPFTYMWALTAQRRASGLPRQPEVQQLLVPHDLRDWSQGRRQNRKDMTGPDHPQLMGLWVLFPKLFRPPCATRLPGVLLI